MADEKVDYLAVWMETRTVETLVDSMVVAMVDTLVVSMVEYLVEMKVAKLAVAMV